MRPVVEILLPTHCRRTTQRLIIPGRMETW
jgi:hypothetical protein